MGDGAFPSLFARIAICRYNRPPPLGSSQEYETDVRKNQSLASRNLPVLLLAWNINRVDFTTTPTRSPECAVQRPFRRASANRKCVRCRLPTKQSKQLSLSFVTTADVHPPKVAGARAHTAVIVSSGINCSWVTTTFCGDDGDSVPVLTKSRFWLSRHLLSLPFSGKCMTIHSADISVLTRRWMFFWSATTGRVSPQMSNATFANAQRVSARPCWHPDQELLFARLQLVVRLTCWPSTFWNFRARLVEIATYSSVPIILLAGQRRLLQPTRPAEGVFGDHMMAHKRPYLVGRDSCMRKQINYYWLLFIDA